MNWGRTRLACYVAYITQAIVNNLAPLLFVLFRADFGVSVERLGALVLLNFGVQLLTDFVAMRCIDRFGWRGPMRLAHALAVAGLVLLAVAPRLFPDPYLGLCLAVVVYAIGGGLLEVLVSPLIEAVPSAPEQKAAQMSLLHSFYCWGHVAVVALTTVCLVLLGNGRWHWLPVVWAIVPLWNFWSLGRVPMPGVQAAHERVPLGRLLRDRGYLLILGLMVCAGAAEQTMSQWSSLFAEKGLGVSKMWGDLLGPCLFALAMGSGRLFFGLRESRLKLVPALAGSAGLCVVAYGLATFSPVPALSLAGCALCGLSVSLFWPGTFSLAASSYARGGTAMFALMALAGDLGCALGPWIGGEVAAWRSALGENVWTWLPFDPLGLRAGVLSGVVFPLAIIGLVLAFSRTVKRPY